MAGLCDKTVICPLAVILTVLFRGHVSLPTTTTTNTAIDTNWFGLGERECFNHTCKFGQYCSTAQSLGGYCRDCEREEMLDWCQSEKNRETLKREKPSCYYICEKHDKELLAERVSMLEMQLVNLTKTEHDKELLAERVSMLQMQLVNLTKTGSTTTETGLTWDWRHSVLVAIAAAEPLVFGAICLICRRRRRRDLMIRRQENDPENRYSLVGEHSNDEDDLAKDPVAPSAPPAPDSTTDNGSAAHDSGNDSAGSSTENVSRGTNAIPMFDMPSSASPPRYPTTLSESQQNINGRSDVAV